MSLKSAEAGQLTSYGPEVEVERADYIILCRRPLCDTMHRLLYLGTSSRNYYQTRCRVLFNSNILKEIPILLDN